MNVPDSLRSLKGRLIVSCQADEQDAFYGHMDLFARAAVAGGAAGIRANGADDIRAIRAAVSVPIIGIQKVLRPDGKVLITPSFEAAQQLVSAGANAIALDCTKRGQRSGALDRLRNIKIALRVPIMADVSTVEEACEAAAAGADFILSTMRGYTDETAHFCVFDPRFIQELTSAVSVPIIAEGRVDTPHLARQAIRVGAFAVVTGTAITRPQIVVRRFAEALELEAAHDYRKYAVAIDVGGTNTKYGIVSSYGEPLWQEMQTTPARSGQAGLLKHLQEIAQRALTRGVEMDWNVECIGIATAGWVDPDEGRVVYATDNLPGWTGARITDSLAGVTRLRVFVENDANALAVAEHQFGAARGLNDFACVTLGTGVGGGCYIGGRLNRGSHFFANALGHICIQPGGRSCTCGRSGCLEAYTNSRALLEYAGGAFASAETLIAAANKGDENATEAIRIFAHRLAAGCTLLLQLLDPEALIFAGGLVQDNHLLMDFLKQELSHAIPNWEQRRLKLSVSTLGYHAGVLGAAAIAFEAST
jgi:predicted NBD/HSP70 family sugar kinase/putative N-acetylmannosamine-6-phosphate epimerase